jgi:hypothetical protein
MARRIMSVSVNMGFANKTLAERAMPAAGMGNPSKKASFLLEILNLASRRIPQLK